MVKEVVEEEIDLNFIHLKVTEDLKTHLKVSYALKTFWCFQIYSDEASQFADEFLKKLFEISPCLKNH